MIKISVIIPAYNCAESIQRTVANIIASGISDYEIVIVDDGSSDGTASICDVLAQQHAYIRCVHQSNAGVSAARNRGVKESSGEYLWFFDADDTAKKHSIPQIEQILCECDPDMLIFGMRFDYYHNGKLYRSDELFPPLDGIKDASECRENLYELFLSNSLSSLCNRMIKKSVVDEMEALLREDMFLYEDLEFSLRVLKQCSNIYYYREAVYQYRQSEDGGNAGRRLMRIPHIPELLRPIEEALTGTTDKSRILLALYQTLAREKIAVSSKADVGIVCDDFRNWIVEKELLPEIEQREYLMLLYRGAVSKLIAKRNYSRIRHTTANWIKQNVGDFRKWRSLS